MTTTSDPWVGRVLLGRYEVTRAVAEGGMAVIYTARDAESGAVVAVKTIKPALLREPGFEARFTREAKALARIRHPHIVRVHDAGQCDGVPFLVMDFKGGGSLRTRHPDGPAGRPGRPPAALPVWLGPVAAALDHIHSLGLVHRDVKPDNVLFDEAGVPSLGDFGIVKVLADGAEAEAHATVVTAAGLVIGTPHYMAAEMLTGQRVDGRTDQYALGVTAYEFLSGVVPYEETNQAMLVIRQLKKQVRPLGDLVPGLPPGLADAVMRAIATNPADRFPTCAEFAAAVSRCVPSKAPDGAADPLPAARPAPPGPRPAGRPVDSPTPGPGAPPVAPRVGGPAALPVGRALPSAPAGGVPAAPAKPADGGQPAVAPRTDARSTRRATGRLANDDDQPSPARTKTRSRPRASRRQWRTTGIVVGVAVIGVVAALAALGLYLSAPRPAGQPLVARAGSSEDGPGRLDPEPPAQPPAASPAGGFVSLFDGKSLRGWHPPAGGRTDAWRVSDGALVGEADGKFGDQDLLSDAEYTDFDLRLEYRWPRPGGVTHVGFRGVDAGSGKVDCMTVLLGDDEGFPRVHGRPIGLLYQTGGIYQIHQNPTPQNKPIGEWNTLRVLVRGQAVRVEHNGRTTADVDLDKHKDKAREVPAVLRPKGRIVLATRWSWRPIEFRTIRIGPPGP